MEGSWESILIRHAHRYPMWQAQDVCKLIHQAVMGSEHAVPGEAAARAWLARELREMGPGPDEPLIDPISPDGRTVRVHLRPFARLALETELLLQAFLRTADEVCGSARDLTAYLTAAEQLATRGELNVAASEIASLSVRNRSEGSPAMHHSAAFSAAYRPAYRVVARGFLPMDVLRRSE